MQNAGANLPSFATRAKKKKEPNMAACVANTKIVKLEVSITAGGACRRSVQTELQIMCKGVASKHECWVV